MPMSKRLDSARLKACRERSWAEHGKDVHFFIPGMYIQDGVQGQYPALSLTGQHCAQGCAHCKGALLHTMPDVSTPEKLVETCTRLASQGVRGVLLSGGCDGKGALPWQKFIPAIARVKELTGLFLSAHCGMVDVSTAQALKCAGIDQALVDIIGSAATYKDVYNLPRGQAQLKATLDALYGVALPVIPHIVAGLHGGQVRGEWHAVDMLVPYAPDMLVLVAFMPLPNTPFATVKPLSAKDVCSIFLHARECLPHMQQSLGCARPRNTSAQLEALALLAGVNRMALPAQESVRLAQRLGLTPFFHTTCCSHMTA